jgi:ankyrin repeat protein
VLLDARADAAHANGEGNTALMLASKMGYTEVVCTLLDAGVQLGQASKNGSTALSMASQSGHADCARAVLEAGQMRAAMLR